MKRLLMMIVLVVTTGIVKGQYDPKARDILDKMSEKYSNLNSFRAEFTYTLQNKMENIQEEFSGNIIVKGDKFKLDLGEQIIFNDGETLWTYLEDVNEVNIDYYLPEDGDMTPTNIFTAYKDGYKYMIVGEETLNNRPHHIIDLVPDDPDKAFYKVKLWINKNDYSLDQWKLFDKTGNTYLYDIESFNGSFPVSDTEFVFDPEDYPGVTEIDLR